MKSLELVRQTLMGALGNESLFSLVATRIALQTGVDLKSIPSGRNEDTVLLASVLKALKDMGYFPEQLTLVANRNAKR